GPEEPCASAERIRSALGDDVDKNTRRLHRDIGAARRDLHFVNRVEVHDERTTVGDIVSVHAVNKPAALAVTRASREHADLLAVVGATDVLTIAGDPWCLCQHLEHI